MQFRTVLSSSAWKSTASRPHRTPTGRPRSRNERSKPSVDQAAAVAAPGANGAPGGSVYVLHLAILSIQSLARVARTRLIALFRGQSKSDLRGLQRLGQVQNVERVIGGMVPCLTARRKRADRPAIGDSPARILGTHLPSSKDSLALAVAVEQADEIIFVLTESQRTTLANSLRIAADRFKEHSEMLRSDPEVKRLSGGRRRLADQFDRQREGIPGSLGILPDRGDPLLPCRPAGPRPGERHVLLAPDLHRRVNRRLVRFVFRRPDDARPDHDGHKEGGHQPGEYEADDQGGDRPGFTPPASTRARPLRSSPTSRPARASFCRRPK